MVTARQASSARLKESSALWSIIAILFPLHSLLPGLASVRRMLPLRPVALGQTPGAAPAGQHVRLCRPGRRAGSPQRGLSWLRRSFRPRSWGWPWRSSRDCTLGVRSEKPALRSLGVGGSPILRQASARKRRDCSAARRVGAADRQQRRHDGELASMNTSLSCLSSYSFSRKIR